MTVNCCQLLPNFQLYCTKLILRIIPRISIPITFQQVSLIEECHHDSCQFHHAGVNCATSDRTPGSQDSWRPRHLRALDNSQLRVIEGSQKLYPASTPSRELHCLYHRHQSPQNDRRVNLNQELHCGISGFAQFGLCVLGSVAQLEPGAIDR